MILFSAFYTSSGCTLKGTPVKSRNLAQCIQFGVHSGSDQQVQNKVHVTTPLHLKQGPELSTVGPSLKCKNRME